MAQSNLFGPERTLPVCAWDGGPAGKTGFRRAAGHRGRLPANIYYPTEIVSFDGVLQALRGPDLRACRNVETNLASRDSLSVLNLL